MPIRMYATAGAGSNIGRRLEELRIRQGPPRYTHHKGQQGLNLLIHNLGNNVAHSMELLQVLLIVIFNNNNYT